MNNMPENRYRQKKQYTDGETICIWGNEYSLQIIKTAVPDDIFMLFPGTGISPEALKKRFRHDMSVIELSGISDLLCVPTELAAENLRNESVDIQKVVLTGDVMKDAARAFLPMARKPQVDIPEKFVLCTLHRAENTDNPDILKELMLSLELIAEFVPVVLPIHPRTKNKLNEISYPFETSRIHFIDPVGYLEMLYLLNQCALVLTDSGGVQKEAYFAHKFCLTLRAETEWVELCARGYNHLLGHNHLDIVTTTRNFLEMPPIFADDLYGDGHAARKIVQAILQR